MGNFKPNDNFLFYLYWMCERQDIFWKRYEGKTPPYTEDEILIKNKFTNVYKALDRATQFEFSNVIYNGKQYSKEDMFYRILIYKHFNSPATWDVLTKELGDITLKKTSFGDITEVLLDHQNRFPDFKLYSNAYMLTAAFLAGNNGDYVHLKGNGWKKFQYYFYIFQKELFDNGYYQEILKASSLQEVYSKLIRVTSFADFLTYQYMIDFNYSEIFNFDENSFALAGLGSVRGMERTFDFKGKAKYEDVAFFVQQNLEQLLEDYSKKFSIKLDFKPLPNRMPTNVDCLNMFCETDKYMRGLGIQTEGKEIHGKRIKAQFKENKEKINYIFPPKWNVKI